MKYREIILALLPAALLAGCSENTISDEAVYESSAAETSAPVTQVVTESAVMPETSSVTSVTAESDAELPDADEKVTFTYSIEQSEEITGDDVLNIFDQSGNQVLSICQPFIDDMKICFDDYNFDGYDDLFFGVYWGDYWIYDPETNSFAKSDEINSYVYYQGGIERNLESEIGYYGSFKIEITDKKEKTGVVLKGIRGAGISLEHKLNVSFPAYYRKVKWQGDHWETVRQVIAEHRNGEYEEYLSYYEPNEDGNMVLTKQLYFDKEKREFAEAELSDDIPYVCLTDTAFCYMNGDRLIQKEEFGTEPELYKKGLRGFEHGDFNSDGYDDIMCYCDPEADSFSIVSPRGQKWYYIFDPEKNEYVENDKPEELDLSGNVRYTPVHTDKVYGCEDSAGTKTLYYYFDNEGNVVFDRIYEYPA